MLLLKTWQQMGHIFTYQNLSFYDKFFNLICITSENPDGAKRTRTADPLHAMQVLYQLSYGPNHFKYINLNLDNYICKIYIYLKIRLFAKQPIIYLEKQLLLDLTQLVHKLDLLLQEIFSLLF